MRTIVRISLLLTLVAACEVAPTPVPTLTRALAAGEISVPVRDFSPVNGVPFACAGVGYDGEYRLHGSPTDARVVWVTFPDGSRHEVGWPSGYRARFTPGLELLDEGGRVVAREGSLVTGGCPTRDPGVLWVELPGVPGP